MPLIISITIVQVNWFVVILSAAKGMAWVGAAAVAVGLIAHARIVPDFARERSFIAAAVIVGIIADSFLGAVGALSYPGTPGVWMAQPFMIALWLNFALVFPLGLAWLHDRLLLGAGLGSIGGAGAYLGGAHFGAVAVDTPTAVAWIAVVWAGAMPVLLILRRWLVGVHPEPALVDRDSGSHVVSMEGSNGRQ
jgi:hypothetical protein